MAENTVKELLGDEASLGWGVNAKESFLAPLDTSDPEARRVLEQLTGRRWSPGSLDPSVDPNAKT